MANPTEIEAAKKAICPLEGSTPLRALCFDGRFPFTGGMFEMPLARRRRYRYWGLSKQHIDVIMTDPEIADYYDRLVIEMDRLEKRYPN